MRLFAKSIILFLILLVGAATVQGATALPQAPWYAVTWVEATDTLHWVNANGEQASIQRPKLNGEISQAQTRLHMSPDGRYLVVISPLNTGREGIGFFNLETGQFVQTHETEANEVFLPAGDYPFTEYSGHFAIPLRNTVTGAWRMIVFESATGDAIHQLTWNDNQLPQSVMNNPNVWPRVAHFNADEGMNGLEVRFHVVTHDYFIQLAPTSLSWYIPAVNPYSITPDDLNFSHQAGFDIDRVTGEAVFASFDQQFGEPTVPGAANTINTGVYGSQELVVSENTGSARLPLWLKNGDWIGYYRSTNALVPHWMVMTADGQNGLPLSLNVIDIYHVRDGFLMKNFSAWRLNHVTTLDAEGFSEPGQTIFQPGSAFAVIYTTPTNSIFSLSAVEGPAPSIQQGPDDFQAPQLCGDVLPPRLMVGQTARVSYTDGTNLNFRDAPSGVILLQIPEGTVMDVLAGPDCVDGYNWWQLEIDGTIGWAAEGDTEEYFLEPLLQFESVQITATATPPPRAESTNPPRAATNPPRAESTNPPRAATNPPRAESTNPPRAATNPPRATEPDCAFSPATRLQIGMTAQVVYQNGTLAMRETPQAAIPFAQVPPNTFVTVVGGSECRDGIRLWEVTAQINGQTLQGWVAEGYGELYYLQ